MEILKISQNYNVLRAGAVNCELSLPGHKTRNSIEFLLFPARQQVAVGLFSWKPRLG